MQLSRSPALVLAVSLCTGCAVGPDYVRPQASMPDQFRAQAAAAQRQSHQTARLATWWEGFGDPTLNLCITRVLAQNLDLAQAAARVMQARAALGTADAALLPSLGVSAQAARAYQSIETPLGRVLNSSPGFDRSGSAYDATVGVAWELDAFGSLRRGREAVAADYQASLAAEAAVRLAVMAQTADVYISIRELQARLALALRQAQTQQDLVATVTLLRNQGLAADLQLRQAEGALAQVQAAIPVLESGLEAALNALDLMLGSMPGTHRDALANAAGIPDAPGIDFGDSPAELLRRRPDLIVAERRLAAANARTGMAIGEHYPKFSLAGALGTATSVASANLFTSGAAQASGALGLRWRLFDFGRIDAQIAQSKGQEAEALAAYRQAVLRASGEVEDALSALVKREQQAAALAGGVKSLDRARQAAAAGYERGVFSLIEVLHADDSLLRASDARAQAQASAAHAAVAAFKALGGGWQKASRVALALPR